MKRGYTEGEVEAVAEELIASWQAYLERATIVGFEGELGAGKTTLVQAIARHCGVIENVVSPTFVIAKWYQTSKQCPFTTLVHIDAYRIEHGAELEAIHFSRLLQEPNTLVIIEWPSRIADVLEKKGVLYYTLSHDEAKRTIEGPYENIT